MLGALIAAVRDADDDPLPVAALPVGGQTLIERQVRLAAAAGAGHIVVLVERLPPALIAAIDRLRRDGLEVDVARSADDGADRFHPDERVLIFADGAIAPPPSVARLGTMPAPVLLTLGEDGPAGPFERIDAATRWTGVALVSGDMLRRTVAQLGDWDLHSTLLRRAAGSGARRIDLGDGVAALVRSRAGARAATAGVLGSPSPTTAGPASRILYLPLARACMGLLLDKPVEASWLRLAALLLTALAIAAAFAELTWPALILLILGAFAEATGRLLDMLRLGHAEPDDRLSLLRAGGIALAAIAWAAGRLHQDGGVSLALAVAALAVMAALRGERVLLQRHVDRRAPAVTADADTLVLLAALVAAAGFARWSLAATLLYAGLSFALVQRRFLRSPAVAERTGDGA